MKDNLELKWNYEIKQGNKLIKRIRLKKCKSFTSNWAQTLFGTMSGRQVTMTDFSGTPVTFTFNASSYGGGADNSSFRVTAGATSSYGLVVGTGITAAAIADYAMDTQIIHGTGAGQLSHGTTTVSSPSATATEATFRITRIFTNSSGGDINVEEIGLVNLQVGGGYFLIIRDVTGTLAVLNGQSLTINYDLTTTI